MLPLSVRTKASDEQAEGVPRVLLSVVAPCYNEAEVLPEFVRRVSAACRGVSEAYEIILVDDGSSDNTWQVMQNLQSHPEVVAVKMARNHGHQLALTAGLYVCRGDRILIIDADLQDPPELLAEMMRMVDLGVDVVYGQRLRREGESWAKRQTARLFYRAMSYLSEVPIPLDTGDFRLITRRVLDVLNAMPERHRFVRGMIAWIGFKQAPILYVRQPRMAGETKYPYRKMLRLAMDAVVAFSTKPLAIASILAVVASAFGVTVLLYALWGWLAGRTVSGWTSMLGAMAILSSAQLLMLGILGQYVGRLYQQVKDRPMFIIETVQSASIEGRQQIDCFGSKH